MNVEKLKNKRKQNKKNSERAKGVSSLEIKGKDLFLNQQLLKCQSVTTCRAYLAPEHVTIQSEDNILWINCSELTLYCLLWLGLILSHFNFIEMSMIKQSPTAAFWTVLFENITILLKQARNMGEGASCLFHGWLWIAILRSINSAST